MSITTLGVKCDGCNVLFDRKVHTDWRTMESKAMGRKDYCKRCAEGVSLGEGPRIETEKKP